MSEMLSTFGRCHGVGESCFVELSSASGGYFDLLCPFGGKFLGCSRIGFSLPSEIGSQLLLSFVVLALLLPLLCLVFSRKLRISGGSLLLSLCKCSAITAPTGYLFFKLPGRFWIGLGSFCKIVHLRLYSRMSRRILRFEFLCKLRICRCPFFGLCPVLFLFCSPVSPALFQFCGCCRVAVSDLSKLFLAHGQEWVWWDIRAVCNGFLLFLFLPLLLVGLVVGASLFFLCCKFGSDFRIMLSLFRKLSSSLSFPFLFSLFRLLVLVPLPFGFLRCFSCPGLSDFKGNGLRRWLVAPDEGEGDVDLLGAFTGLGVVLCLMNIDPVDQFEDHVLGQFVEFPVFADSAEETVGI